MASKALDIIVKVRDAASGKLREVGKSFKEFGDATKKAKFDMVEFNRTMFGASAFLGFFQKQFSSLGSVVTEGVQLDRVNDQFQAVFGEDSNISTAIKKWTGTTIDRVEAMRSAISLKTLGITRDLDQTAEIIARAGTASKMAGFDAAEGVKHFTQFLKNGEVSNLEFLNVLRGADPAFKLQMSLLGKYGGVLGTALTAQEKLNRGMALLRMATKDMNPAVRDLMDIVVELQQSFKFTRAEIGSFVASALGPLFSKFSSILDILTMEIQHLRKTDKGFLALGQTIIFATSALAGFVATFGLFKLVTKGVGFLGINLGALAKVLVIGVGLFTLLTNHAKDAKSGIDGLSDSTKKFIENSKFKAILNPLNDLMKRLSLFGSFVKGIFQLVTSYFDEGNIEKGIGKIDKSLYKLLSKNKLMGLAQMFAQISIFVFKFVKDTITQISMWSTQMTNTIEKVYNRISKFFGMDKLNKGWFKGLFDESNGVRKSIVKVTAALVSLWAAAKMFRSVRALLSHIPIIGKFFGAPGKDGKTGKQGPSGSASDPIYTKDASLAGQLEKFSRLGQLFSYLKNAPIMKPILKIAMPILRPFIKLGSFLIRPLLKLAAPIVRVALPILRPLMKLGSFILKPILKLAMPVLRPIVRLAGSMFSGLFKSLFGNTLELGAVFKSVSSIFRSGAGIRSIFVGLRSLGGVVAGAAAEFVLLAMLIKTAEGVITSVINNFSIWKTLAVNIFNYLNSAFRLGSQQLSEWFSNLPARISGVLDAMKASGADIWNSVSSSIGNALSNIGSQFSGGMAWLDEFTKVTPVLSFFRNKLTEVASFMQTMVGKMGEWLQGIFSSLQKWVQDTPVVSSILGATAETLGEIGAAFGKFAQSPLQTPMDFGKAAGDLAATYAQGYSQQLSTGTVKNDLSTISKTGTVTTGMIPNSEENREGYLQEAIRQMFATDQAKGDQMQRLFSEAMRDSQITPEEFATVLGARLESGIIGKGVQGTHNEAKKSNNMPSRDNATRRGC